MRQRLEPFQGYNYRAPGPECSTGTYNLNLLHLEMSAYPATSRKRKSPDADAGGADPDDENKINVEQWLTRRCEKQVHALKKRSANNVKRLRSEFDEVRALIKKIDF